MSHEPPEGPKWINNGASNMNVTTKDTTKVKKRKIPNFLKKLTLQNLERKSLGWGDLGGKVAGGPAETNDSA